jgi:predicted TIM-barrel fold metal-dependent hydrolase
MIIDGHIHAGDWKYKHYASLSVSVKDLNSLLRESRIDGAILFPSDKKDNTGLLNQIKKYAKMRYWFFPWIDPRQSGWRQFTESHINDISGLKVHSSLDRIMGGLTNDIYRPLLEFSRENKLLMYVHCGRWQEASSYKFVLRMAREYRDIKFIISHLGGDHEELKLRAPADARRMKLENVIFDISATREFWTISNGVKLLGAGRFIFGSDYPIMHPRVAMECVKVLRIPEKQKKMILGENLLNLLDQNKAGD